MFAMITNIDTFEPHEILKTWCSRLWKCFMIDIAVITLYSSAVYRPPT